MRVLLCLSLLIVGQPAHAGVFDVPPKNYYGPLQRLHGVGFTSDVTKDGYLKIHAQARRIDGDGFAVDSALYRAAEMARVGGYRYVEMHDAYSHVTASVKPPPSLPSPPIRPLIRSGAGLGGPSAATPPMSHRS